MAKIRNIQLQPHCNYEPLLAQSRYSHVSIGYDQQLYWLSCLEEPDFREVKENGGSVPKITPDQAQTYRIQAFSGTNMTLDVTLPNMSMNVHYVQPLPDNELLLVCSRSEYRGKDDFDRNALVYSREGVFLRSFLLGDGINHVQTTERGIIWVGYFDEGVSGNFGWTGRIFDCDTGRYMSGAKPIGRDGLLAWNARGKVLYRYRPAEAMMGLDIWSISDCYVMNVASASDTWFYYYDSFPLVHLHKRKILDYWKVPVKGSGAVAVSGGYALFSGGYNERNVYHLLALGHTGSKARNKGKFSLLDENGEPLTSVAACGRGDTLYLIRNKKLYLLRVGDVCSDLQ